MWFLRGNLRSQTAIRSKTLLPDVAKYDMTYYNPITRLGLKGKLEDVGRDPLSRIAFRGVGCNCESTTCGCCAGVNITAFKFDHRACTNFTYFPEDFAINVTFMVNDKVLVKTGVLSGNVSVFHLRDNHVGSSAFFRFLFSLEN